MEVDAVSFPHRLLGLLTDISEADFVSFDLELSGIPSRLPGRKPHGGRERKTLEDRYAETKAGAERYQILQVGLTCARFDYITNKYILRPYNININPLVDERLDIEREISFQSGACTFLLNNGFDLGMPFSKGVQYLSREEAERARQMVWDRLDKKSVVEDLQLKEEDVDSLDFVRRAREAVTKWRATGSTSLEITTHTGLPEQPFVSVISRFEKRLVHQLIRAEFPDLVSIGRADCIKIINFDPVREADNARRIKNRVKEQIAKQTGFRWIFEALVRGDIDLADPMCYAQNAIGMIIATDTHDMRDRFQRTQERLKSNQPVLVGHNMFTDLVYLYRTFVGELPDTLQKFCEAVHKLFPRIVDTKYLATYAEGDLNASPTLQVIAEELENQPLPEITTHPDYSKYQEKQAYHEAGYDSLLTATIMLRLSARLDAETKKNDLTIPMPSLNTKSECSFKSTFEDLPELADGQEKVQGPILWQPVEDPVQQGSKKKRKNRGKKKSLNSNSSINGKFHTHNLFENLREMRLSSESEQNSSDETAEKQPKGTTKDSEWETSGTTAWQCSENWVPLETVKRKPMELIPAFNSQIWNEFGNTLRIFGTQERLLKIADWEYR